MTSVVALHNGLRKNPAVVSASGSSRALTRAGAINAYNIHTYVLVREVILSKQDNSVMSSKQYFTGGGDDKSTPASGTGMLKLPLFDHPS